MKIKMLKHAKKSSFLKGGWGEVIRVMTSWSGGKGALTPLTKILRTPLSELVMIAVVV